MWLQRHSHLFRTEFLWVVPLSGRKELRVCLQNLHVCQVSVWLDSVRLVCHMAKAESEIWWNITKETCIYLRHRCTTDRCSTGNKTRHRQSNNLIIMKDTVIWCYVLSIDEYQRFGGRRCCLHLPIKWRLQTVPKRRYTSAELHDITS
jgi:hypothetical protein